MKKLRSILITNIVGLLLLFLCLFGYRTIPNLKRGQNLPLSHHNIVIDEVKLKERLALVETQDLQQMEASGQEIKEWMRLLQKGDSHLVQEVVKGEGIIGEKDHYPLGDTFDTESYSQYYYHTHCFGEYGHFHLFLRQGGMGEGIRPLFYDVRNQTLDDSDTFAHLIAISMDSEGHPIGLFTTNRWVTGEDWYATKDVKEMVKHFRVNQIHSSYVVNRWMSAMLCLFQPQIFDLIDQREELLMQYRGGRALKEILEDHNLEIPSETKISIDVQIKVIQELLNERGVLKLP